MTIQRILRSFSPAALALPLAGAAILLSAAAPAEAQHRAGNGREAVANRVERADGRRDLRDDRRDRAAIKRIAGRWNQAVQRGDRGAEAEADRQLAGWLAVELRESRQDQSEAQRERRRSARERGRSRRERRASGSRDDTRDLRDDRRDLRDDRRDERRAAADLAATRRVALELRGLQPRFEAGTATPAQYAQKRALLAELVRLAELEVARERRELREDRRETREDRRERREDRRRRR